METETPTAAAREPSQPEAPAAAREPLTREAVEVALTATRGNVSLAAQRLGTNRREIYRVIHGHGLALDRFRGE